MYIYIFISAKRKYTAYAQQISACNIYYAMIIKQLALNHPAYKYI